MSDFGVAEKLLLGRADIRMRFRKVLGSFLRILQTQHHIAFAVTKFATDALRFCSSFSDVKAMVLAANRII